MTQELITKITQNISTDWRIIGRFLGIRPVKLRAIKNNDEQLENKVTEMFTEWMHRFPQNAKVPVLVTALEKIGRRDVAETVEGIVAASSRELSDS